MSSRHDKDQPPKQWKTWVGVAVFVVAVVGALLTGRVLTSTASEGSTLADQVTQTCAQGGKTADDLRRVGACQQAEQVHTEIIQGERGPGPTADEIRGAVANYLVANPPPAGRAPTPAEVAAAVTDYLVAHPPQPGRPPTAAEIATAAATYFATNPPPAGEKGDTGPGPTPDQIQTAVNQYLADHPPAAGADGAAGPAGPAGPVCPNGSTQQQVTYSDGRAGVGCVLDAQPTTDPMPPGGDGG